MYRSRCGTIPVFNIIQSGKCGNHLRYKLDTNPLLFLVNLHHLYEEKVVRFPGTTDLDTKNWLS
jgi:hypothetical protein